MLGRQRGSWTQTQLGYLCVFLEEHMKVVACAQLLAGTSEAVIGGKLQKDSLSYKLRACGQKVGVCLLQTHFFFSHHVRLGQLSV